jgi:superfamily I DNA/RNA helicase
LALTEFAGHLSTINRETSSLTAEERLLHLTSDPGIAAFFAEEKSREALNRIVSMAANLEANAEGLINSCALYTDTDVYHPRAEKAALMTMHAAKGLEFPVVFIAGCEDELIPYRRPAESGTTDFEEERRLFYVAMTRAKDRLYLTWAKRRSRFGRTTNREISPFVKDIEQHLLIQEALGANHRKRKPDQLKLF